MYKFTELVSGRDGPTDDIAKANGFNQSITMDKVLHKKIISQLFKTINLSRPGILSLLLEAQKC